MLLGDDREKALAALLFIAALGLAVAIGAAAGWCAP
jgi:hypothetical protein